MGSLSHSFKLGDGTTNYPRTEYDVSLVYSISGNKLKWTATVTGTDTSHGGTYKHWLESLSITINGTSYAFSGWDDTYLGTYNKNTKVYTSNTITSGELTTPRLNNGTTMTISTSSYTNQGNTSSDSATKTPPNDAYVHYTLTYQANGGTGSNKTESIKAGNSATLKAANTFTAATTATHSITLNKNGGTGGDATFVNNVFYKWLIGSSYYNAGASYKPSADTTIKATWSTNYKLGTPTKAQTTANGYTVNFDARGGTCSTNSITAKNTISYSFGGWKNDSSGTVYNSGTTVEGASYTAQWTSSTSPGSIEMPSATNSTTTNKTITLNYDGATGGNSTTTLNYTKTVSKPLKGWSANSSATSGSPAGSSFTPGASGTVYAIWGSSSTSYTSVTLPTPTKTNYTFKGWATSSGGSVISTGGSYTPTSDITNLYAIWTLNTYGISFDGNLPGMTVNNLPYDGNLLLCTVGESITIPETKPSKNGKIFLGWSTNSSASFPTLAYKPGSTFTPTSDTTFYAIWGYVLTVSLNGGKMIKGLDSSGNPAETTSNFSVAFTKTSTYGRILGNFPDSFSNWYKYAETANYCEPRKTGYTFNGWTISSGNGSVLYQKADTKANQIKSFFNDDQYYYVDSPGTVAGYYYYINNETTPKDTTITAQWTANTYTVTFNPNGGNTPDITSKNVTYAYTYGTLANCSRTGYTFKGWYTASSGGTQITSSNVVTITSNQTLYAQWTAHTYKIIYDGNNATSGSMSQSSHVYDTAKNLNQNTFKRIGYRFLGWSTSASATTVTYTDQQSVKNLTATKNGTITLYAVWKPIAQMYIAVKNSSGKLEFKPAEKFVYTTKIIRQTYIADDYSAGEYSGYISYEEGQTWAEWCASSYNTYGWYCSNNYVYGAKGTSLWVIATATSVKSTDIINTNGYEFV